MTIEDNKLTFSLNSIDLNKLKPGNNLLQSELWGRFKEFSGWHPRAFHVSGTLGVTENLLVLEKKLYGRFPMAYIPHGPELPAGLTTEEISAILLKLTGQLKECLSPGCFVIRYDLACICSVGESSEQATDMAVSDPIKPFRKSAYRVQPPDTVILPLSGSLDEILMQMHKKTRYNIRLAARNGVVIHAFSGQEAVEQLPRWYALYRETETRNGISVHTESYYRQFLSLAGEQARLYLADYHNEVIAGIIIVLCGRRATYLYGASASRHRELMPNHLLQWQAIQDAAASGAGEYDLFGIPPTDDPGHPMHGLWRFKTGFGGIINHYPGAWDYPLRWGLYSLYNLAEKNRATKVARRKDIKCGIKK